MGNTNGQKKRMQERSIKTGQKMSAQGKILGFQITNISLLKHLTEKNNILSLQHKEISDISFEIHFKNVPYAYLT